MRPRFRIERLVFIPSASVLVGWLLPPAFFPFPGFDAPERMAVCAVLLTGIYVTFYFFQGHGGIYGAFIEQVPTEARIPKFDIRRFLVEPVKIAAIPALVLAILGFAGLCIKLGSWIRL